MSTPEAAIFSKIAAGDSTPAAAPAPQSAGQAAPASQPSEVELFGQIAAQPHTPEETQQPGVAQRVVSAGKEQLGNIASGIGSMVHGAIGKPEDATEHTIAAIGGPGGLIAYRGSKALIDSAENMLKAKKENFEQAKQDFINAAQEFHRKDYRGALTDAASSAVGVTGLSNPLVEMGRGRQLVQGTKEGGDLATPLTKDIVDAGSALAMERIGGMVTRGGDPNVIQRIMKGKGAAQEPAQAAIRKIAGASEETPLLEGHNTVLDESLSKVKAQERAAYKAQDKVADFDVKETRAKLKDAEYKIKQPEIDDATRERLQKTIDESKKALEGAEARLKEEGIDPKAADQIFQKRKAMEEFRKGIVQHVSADGESVNVDGVLNYAKKLRNSKYGDRLEQIAGKQGADEFMAELQHAKDIGAHSLKTQKLFKKIALWAGAGVVGGGAAGLGYKLAH